MEKLIIKDKVLVSLVTILVIVISVFLFVIFKYNKNQTGDKESRLNVVDKKDTVPNMNLAENKEYNSKSFKYNLSDFYKDDDNLSTIVDLLYKKLNDSQRIGQMIVTAAGQYANKKDYVNNLIKTQRVGGVLLLKGGETEFENLIKEFTKTASDNSSLPLIFSCDAEPSLINMKINGSPKFPETSSIKNGNESYSIGDRIAKYLKGLGFHHNFAPVCDYDRNKEIIGDRSFGHDNSKVTVLANSFISGTQDNNIVATAKHFPGHGNVKGDTHKNIVSIEGEPAEKEVFKDVIKNGVISVMVGHIAINGSEKYDTDGKPSTLSKIVVTKLLREELGFKGIIITDAMNMKGVTTFKDPSFNAIKAGCDMVLFPSQEERLIQLVLTEIKTNELFRKQIEESVKRILRLKICLGIINKLK